MSKLSGKLKARARALRGKEAAEAWAKQMSKELELPFVATPDELTEAFKDARLRRIAEQRQAIKVAPENVAVVAANPNGDNL